MKSISMKKGQSYQISNIKRINKRKDVKRKNITLCSLHVWLNKNYKKPKQCSFCKEIKKLDWANITGIYDRNINNYIALCTKCHLRLDLGKKTDKFGRFKCSICKRYKSHSEFTKSKNKNFGIAHCCKRCNSKISTQRRLKIHYKSVLNVLCNRMKKNSKKTKNLENVNCENCLKILKDGGLI